MAQRIPTRRAASVEGVPVHRPPEPDRAAAEKEAKAFYKKADWRRCRALKLAQSPLCETCKAAGRFVAANHVHHIAERRDRPDLAFSLDNLQSLCLRCHSRVSMYRTNKRRGHGEATREKA